MNGKGSLLIQNNEQKTEGHIYLVMEYCSMGDLAQYIKRKRPSKGTRGGLSEHFVRHFLKQLGKLLWPTDSSCMRTNQC